MATEVKRRRGTTAQHQEFIGAEAEITVDIEKYTLLVHDNSGTKPTGHELLRADFSNIPTSVTADVTIVGEVDATKFSGDLTGAIHVQGKNDTGGTLTKGTPVYISGQVGAGQQFTIAVADADDSAKMPCIGILAADVNANGQGDIVTHGKLIGIDTSSFTVGDELYISSSGTLVATPPTGESNLLQRIAKVIRVDSSDGQIYIMGAGRTNAVPNLNQNKIFLGDSNNRAVATALSSIGLTSFNDNSTFLKDADFGSNGLMKRTSDGVYTTITDSSSNWDAAYTYSQVGHLPLTGGTISQNLTISGNLTVSGTTTTVNTETINLADNIITLNSNFTGNNPTENAGIEVERGDLTNKSFFWDETNDRWNADSSLVASSFIKQSNSGGFLKANGTEDTNTYLTTVTEAAVLAHADNYANWTLTVGATNQDIGSGDALTLTAGTGISLSISGANVTIGSTISDGDITAVNTQSNSGLSGGSTSGDIDLSLDISNLTAITTTDSQDSIAILDGSTTKKITLGNIPLSALNDDSTFLKDADFTSNGFLKRTGDGTYTVDTNTYLTSETSHSDVLVDGDFATAGFMKTDGSGTYSVDGSTFDNYNHWTISDGTNSGDIDSDATLTVAAGTGITTTYSSSTQTLTIESTLAGGDITAVNTATGSGLSGGASTGAANLQISVLNLTDMTDDVVGGDDELIIRDASVVGNQTRRKAISEIKLSQFNNDAGFITSAGDITEVTAGDGLSGGGTSGSVTISHADTSTSGGLDSTGNSNGTVIQNASVSVDTYGHVTTTSVSTTNLDNRYLQLSGGILTGDTKLRGGDLFLDATAVNGTGNRRIRFTEGSSTSAGFQGGYIYYDGDANKLHLGMHDAADSNTANDLDAITILRGNQNVGIGTDSPDEKFSVIGNAGLYGTVSGGIVSPASLKFFTSEDSAGLGDSTDANKQNIGTISWTGKDPSQNATGEYANIKTYIIDTNHLIQGSANEGGQIEFSILRHDVSSETRVEYNALTIANNGSVGINDTTPSSSFKLDVNGAGRFVNDLYADEDLVVADNIYLSDTNTALLEGGSNSVKIQTDSGFIELGPKNTSYSHIETDRNNFYFNKQLIVNTGIVESYDEDLQLRRAQSSTDVFIIKDNEFEFKLAGSTQAKIEPDGKLTLITSTTTKPSINSGSTGTEILRIESGDLYINSSHVYIDNSANVDGDLVVASSITSGSFIKDGGTSSQFLKADGSVDSNTYITSASGTFLPLTGGALTGATSITTSTNRVLTLDYTGAGSYTLMSFKQSGTEQFRLWGSDTDNYLSFYNDQSNGHQLTLASNGNVGVGTTSPSSKLEVSSADTVKTAIHIDNTSTGGNRWDIASLGSAVTGRVGNLQIRNDSDSANYVEITAAGNVGIGNTAPAQKLVVNGGVHAYGNITTPASGTHGLLMDFYISNSRFWSRGTGANRGGFDFVSLKNDGTSQITPFQILTSGVSRFNFNLEAEEDLIVDGDVGIGTDSPASKLDISQDDNTTNDLDVLNLKRVWSSATSADRSHGIKFSDTNATLANIYADRTNSAANYNGDLVFVTNSGASGTNTSEKMRIDSSGNVGIGTSSPDSILEIAGTTPTLTIDDTRTGSWVSGDKLGTVSFRTSDGSASGAREIGFIHIENEQAGTNTTMSGAMVFGSSAYNASASEKMRIDSSGNVLVGKTDANNTSQGNYFQASDGFNSIVSTSNTALLLNRLSTDGTLLLFRKDSTTVGSISSDVGRIAINSSGNNLFLQVGGSTKMAIDTNGKVYPATHNANDLGFSTSLAWRDLYLSGDANIGGDVDVGGSLGVDQSSPQGLIHIGNGSGASAYQSGNGGLTIERSGRAAINLLTPNTSDAYIFFADPQASNAGYVGYEHANDRMVFRSQDDFYFQGNNVGIGASSPSAKLHVFDSAAGAKPMLQVMSHATAAGSFTNNYMVEFNHAFSTVNHGMLVKNNESADARRTLDVADANGVFASFTNGKVGIGTTSPSAKLHVNDTTYPTLRLSTATSYSNIYHDGTTGSLIYSADDGNAIAGSSHQFYVDGSSAMTIDSNGNVMVGGTVAGNASTISLNVGNVGSTSGGLQLWGTTTGTHYIQFGDESGTAANHYRGYIGYAHNGDSLRFGTASTERMRIHSNGDIAFRTTSQVENFHFDSSETRLGIGNATPDYTLDLNSGGSTTTARVSGVTNSASQAILRMTGYSVAGTQADIGAINFTNAADTGDAIVSSITAQKEGTQATAAGELQFKTKPYNGSLSTRMTIQGDGNVGIGTNSPSEKLHISGTNSGLRIDGGTSYTNTSTITLSNGRAKIDSEIIDGTAQGDTAIKFSNRVVGTLAERMRIHSNGNVGIGTTNPSEFIHIETSTGSPAILVKAAGQTGSTAPTAELILSNGSLSSNDSAPKITAYRTADYSVTALRSSGLKFQVTKANAGLTAMTIDSNGNVGIGTTSIDSSDGRLKISSPSGNGNPSSIALYGTNGGAFGGSNVVRSKIDTITDGTAFGANMRFYTNDTSNVYQERMRILSSGGITFNGDTATANALDDYEEGTFTPQIHAGASNPAFNSNNYGKYTKIGNVVHCSGRFSVNSITAGPSGTSVELGGLPFAASTPLGDGTGAIAGSIGFASGFAGESPTMMQIRDNETNALLYYQNSSLGVSNLKGNDFGTGAHSIVFQITYHV